MSPPCFIRTYLIFATFSAQTSSALFEIGCFQNGRWPLHRRNCYLPDQADSGCSIWLSDKQKAPVQHWCFQTGCFATFFTQKSSALFESGDFQNGRWMHCMINDFFAARSSRTPMNKSREYIKILRPLDFRNPRASEALKTLGFLTKNLF